MGSLMKHPRRSSVLLARLIVLAACCLVSAPTATAQFDATTVHYRFLPRHSILNETGGFYPRDIDYRVFGTFDWRDTTRIPFADGFISFRNVDAWASHPILAYVLDLDRVLGLSNLTGYQLPVMSPFDVYKFEGKTDDESSVELYATVIGPWLRLRGGTTPPPGSADFFVYNLQAVARRTPFADFNDSSTVEADDLTKWSGGFGTSPTVSDTSPFGDANNDLLVDGTDFLTWQRQLGEAAPPVAALDAAMDAALASLSAAVAPVPEPGSLAIFCVAALVFTVRRR